MNERIKELYYKAHDTSDVEGSFPQYFSATKFAELIVQECTKVIHATSSESIDLGRTLDENAHWIESDIKTHFGVE